MPSSPRVLIQGPCDCLDLAVEGLLGYVDASRGDACGGGAARPGTVALQTAAFARSAALQPSADTLVGGVACHSLVAASADLLGVELLSTLALGIDAALGSLDTVRQGA